MISELTLISCQDEGIGQTSIAVSDIFQSCLVAYGIPIRLGINLFWVIWLDAVYNGCN